MSDLNGEQVVDHTERVFAELRDEHAQLKITLSSVSNREIIASRQDFDAVRKLTL